MKQLTAFQKDYLAKLREEEISVLAENFEIISSFKKYCEAMGIFLGDDNFKYYHTSGIIATYPNLIALLNDDLTVDKEGLLDFDILCKQFARKRFMNGFLDCGNYMLMAHYYFRRGYHQINNFAPSFIDMFWELPKPKMQSYISIDPDSVRINMDGYAIMERDMWFGAKFDKFIESIPDGIVKLRPPLDVDDSILSFFFASAYCLDVKWSTKEFIKSIQIEEFKSEEITITKNTNDYYPVRYIHAEYDLQSQSFRHFDGAIHFYSSEEYFRRRDNDFNYNSKNTNHIKTLSQKLFKINGTVEVEHFVEFTSHFFTKNPLIIEYFEGGYPKYIIEMLEKVRANN
ncbi:hypothetical protein [Pedobacter frigoris]|uniref:Uncharacterized protein n=1 Tax=Pedobacter frigoris TaxID=2571272 RepID=A0A4U1CDR4_9SPHI|nr:hypothetical protein [Pedobacter frigoris]TKC04354.1 hypothetical protein FA047_17370 [Pedobacter frigoris]